MKSETFALHLGVSFVLNLGFWAVILKVFTPKAKIWSWIEAFWFVFVIIYFIWRMLEEDSRFPYFLGVVLSLFFTLGIKYLLTAY